ncbi:MAG: hypothetical protein ACREQY_07805, partial [Candidatus Binatia bacterium]
QGEIWLVFGSDGRSTRATAVGATGPKVLAASLVQFPLTIPVPPGNRARLPLKLLGYCSASGECSLTLEPPGQTWGGFEEANG